MKKELYIPCDYIVNEEGYELMIETQARALTDNVVDQLVALRKEN